MNTVCLSLDCARSFGAGCTALGFSVAASPRQERGKCMVDSFSWPSCTESEVLGFITDRVDVERWALVCQAITEAWLAGNSSSVGFLAVVEAGAVENVWAAPVDAPVASVVAPVAPVVAPVAPVAPVAFVAPVASVAPVVSVSPVAPVAPSSPVAPVVLVSPVAAVAPVSSVAFVAPVSHSSADSLPSSFSCLSLGVDDMEIDSAVSGVDSFWSLTFSSSSFLFPLLEQDNDVSPSAAVARALAPFAAGGALLSGSVPLSPFPTEPALAGEMDLEEVNPVTAVGSAVDPVAPVERVSDVAFVFPFSPSSAGCLPLSLSCPSLGGDSMEIDPVMSGVGSFWSLTFSSSSFLFPLLEQDSDVSPSAAVARALAPFAAGGALLSGSLSLSLCPVEPSLADEMDLDEVEPASAVGSSVAPVPFGGGVCGSSSLWAAGEPHYAEFKSVVPVGVDFGFSGPIGNNNAKCMDIIMEMLLLDLENDGNLRGRYFRRILTQDYTSL
ncbi:uncharacterized protein EV154DRAFT_481859 [Mucor mucedo]|uniref:uncharacterized protein n=1 Tax=Mucor mucedo TaxID=29922 RepID=UPI00221FC0F2|nr:uncharacterized protein EV154DRAFT_481859 [Mucor mucedo]KAI7890733.1 hypothetical protein EV154DRAFT_481859 [Mucor mucedo]